jgi:hypothetical protein
MYIKRSQIITEMYTAHLQVQTRAETCAAGMTSGNKEPTAWPVYQYTRFRIKATFSNTSQCRTRDETTQLTGHVYSSTDTVINIAYDDDYVMTFVNGIVILPEVKASLKCGH